MHPSLLIFVTPGHNWPFNEDIYYIYSGFTIRQDHPLSIFHTGHYLMTKAIININYVTRDIINLLATKNLWAPLLPFAAISVFIMMMKVMIIRCFG